jgi:hypothetical protein
MSAGLDLTAAEWVKSSYSTGDGGQCVEFSLSHARSGAVPVRDSKVHTGDVLVFAPTGWSGFVEAVKGGQLSA